VAAGTYDRTYTNSGGGPTGLADPATVSGYRLDKYLVTVGRFRQFVSAWNGGSGYTPPAGSGKHAHLNGGLGLANSASPGNYESGWVLSNNGNVMPTTANLTVNGAFSTWTATPGSNENKPINGANWYEANAFCIWDGGFLPSESEWEYAAAGGNQQREYPWGTTAPGTANQYAIYAAGTSTGCYYPSSGTCTGAVNIAPVGTATLGAGVWGQLDMAGEEFEWNLDTYAPYVDPCSDCANLSSPSSVAFRGGNFGNDAADLAPMLRAFGAPTNRYYGVGFRCARTP
jgi:formylglycine-generating enzyme required for sulfatase activity